MKVPPVSTQICQCSANDKRLYWFVFCGLNKNLIMKFSERSDALLPAILVRLLCMVLRSGGKNKCVELSAQVIFKARFFFSKFNYGVTNQARCRLAITIASTSEI